MSLLEQQSSLSIEEQLSFAYQIEAITQENDTLKEKVSTLEAENITLQDEVARLKEQLELAKHQRFGKKSEVGEPLSTETTKLIHINAHTRKKKQKAD